MMKVLSVPVVFSTVTGLPARSSIHAEVVCQSLLRLRRPAFPRRLISWSGLPTSLEVKTHSGRPSPGLIGGVRVFVAGSLARIISRDIVKGVEKDVLLDLCNTDGSERGVGDGGDRGRGTVEPVRDELLGVVLADS
jgi:hypothetical protein